MTASIFKSIAFGVLAGAALFFAPFFLLRFLLFFLIIGAFIRFFVGRKFRRGWRPGFHTSFADRIRNMTDEEYAAFKQQYSYGCYPNMQSTATQAETK